MNIFFDEVFVHRVVVDLLATGGQARSGNALANRIVRVR